MGQKQFSDLSGITPLLVLIEKNTHAHVIYLMILSDANCDHFIRTKKELLQNWFYSLEHEPGFHVVYEESAPKRGTLYP